MSGDHNLKADPLVPQRDDFSRLALEAGATWWPDAAGTGTWDFEPRQLQAFADRVGDEAHRRGVMSAINVLRLMHENAGDRHNYYAFAARLLEAEMLAGDKPLAGCSECGVTSSNDSMTALYCVPCAEIFFKHVTEAAVLAEREACAQVADAFDPEQKWSNYGRVIARSIRERGKP